MPAIVPEAKEGDEPVKATKWSEFDAELDERLATFQELEETRIRPADG